jgi:hypothetical protein
VKINQSVQFQLRHNFADSEGVYGIAGSSQFETEDFGQIFPTSVLHEPTAAKYNYDPRLDQNLVTPVTVDRTGLRDR